MRHNSPTWIGIICGFECCAVPCAKFGTDPIVSPEQELEGKGAGELVTRLGEYRVGAADWGYLFVPENRAAARARLIRLAVVLETATSGEAASSLPNSSSTTRRLIALGSAGLEATDAL